MHHYLRPLVRPESVALIGASDREGSIGRTTYQNLLAGGYTGALYAVNPNHQTMFDRPVHGSLVDIGEPVELVIIAAPAAAVPRIIEEAGAVKAKAAVLMTTPPVGDARLARRWSREVLANARAKNIRVVGAGALGVIRTDIGLNATFCAPPALVGRLAIIAQSGAVATALLDFAATLGIGFSTVISLGGEMDVGFGELLDCMLLDSATDGILLYIEEVHDARSFLSALRAAARVKPVVVLKAGKSVEPHRDPSADAVFDAALRRAGTVRVHTYTQLFAAARILASGRIPQGDRIAIVSNGRGPALLAADSVAERGVNLATLSPATVAALDTVLPVESVRTNPVDVRGDARAERFATAVELMLDDEQVDAVLALHVPRPISGATEVAQAIADVARKSRKPILAAWLGAINRREVHAALASGGIADFYTPENAIDAFAFLAAYRRNQAWLLEVPPPAPEPEPPHLDAAEEVRTLLAAEARSQLTIGESYTLLTAFGMTPLPFALVATRPDAELAAKRLHFPVSLALDAYDVHEGITGIRSRHSLSKAWDRLLRTAESAPPVGWNGYTLITRDIPRSGAANIAIAVASDPVFGPVIMLGPSLPVRPPHRAETLMLPPLNRRLAGDLIANVPELGLADSGSPGGSGEALARLLTQLSALVCALPWVHELVLDPVIMIDGTPTIVAARMAVDPKRKLQPAYRHMAIHPYPTELIAEVKLRDGTPLLIRPIRPEDAELEREFVHSLSDESRYFRFFYRLSELTPGMLARFTQVDYDREVALVAVADDATSTHREFVGVARYITNPDQESAEFAVVIADAWQRRGVARILMERLMASAKKGGLKRLEGAVLRANRKMLDFVTSLGFTTHEDPEDSDQVIAVRIL